MMGDDDEILDQELDQDGTEDVEGESPPEPEKRAEPSDIEREAALMGHVPKEEFRGNPEDWIDAETFVKRGREIMPILRKNNERLTSKVFELEKTLIEDRKTFSEFQKFQEQALQNQKAQALEQLKAARKEAIALADGDAFERAEEGIRRVEAYEIPQHLKPREVQPQIPEELIAWVGRNKWYETDPALRAVADEIGKSLRANGYDRPGPEFLEEVGKRVRMAMPDKFENPARKQPQAVDSPAPRARKPNGKSYEDLPPDAKAICDRFVNTIKGYTREQYVRDYQWS